MERQEAGVQELKEFRRRLGRGKEFGLFAVDSNNASSYFATHRLLPPDSRPLNSCNSCLLTLQTLFDLNDARERVDEVLKSTSRKHDGVPTPTNIFCDFQKPSAFVLFEIEKEDLAINLNLLGCERFIYLVWCVVINHDLPFLLSP